MKKVLSTLLGGARRPRYCVTTATDEGSLRSGDPAHRSAQGRTGRPQAPALPRGSRRDRPDVLVDDPRRVPPHASLVGARINYGITDWLAIGVWGALRRRNRRHTSLTDQIDETRAARHGEPVAQPDERLGFAELAAQFQKQVAQISYMAMPQITAVPFRGKFALFQSIFADVDAYHLRGLRRRRDQGARGLPATSSHLRDA